MVDKESASAGRRPRRWHEGPLLLLTAVVVLTMALASAFGFGLITRTAASNAAAGNRPSATAAGSSSPSEPAKPSPTASATPTAHASVSGGTFSAISGFGCPSHDWAQFAEHGRYTRGIRGFFKVGTGGWKQQGCDGTFDAMPMSGSATKARPGIFALWAFRPDSGLRCRVYVYVPDDPSIRHVGGNPARYRVYDTAAPSGTAIGAFVVNQVANRGRWVSAGSFASMTGLLTIELTDTGVGKVGKTHVRLAVASVRLSCARP